MESLFRYANPIWTVEFPKFQNIRCTGNITKQPSEIENEVNFGYDLIDQAYNMTKKESKARNIKINKLEHLEYFYRSSAKIEDYDISELLFIKINSIYKPRVPEE